MSPRKNKKKKVNIRTLSDLDSNRAAGGQHPSAYHQPIAKRPLSNNAAPLPTGPIKFDNFRVCHIPTLPNAKEASAMIQRVVKEFEPIIQRRGYNVRSVSELCCCFDGLDFTPTTQERSKRPKKRKMANNVLGYNQTSFRGRGQKSHTIHLRLRHPASHDRLYLYEDVAGTMAHELAHCEIGPHNDAFNKLMDEILEEHMVLQCQAASGGSNHKFGGGGTATGATASFGGFPGQGQALGGNGKASSLLSTQGGHKLGGDNAFSKFLSPKEAAVMAAEARRRQQKLRLRGSRCCQPCTITIPDNDEEEPTVEYHEPIKNKGDKDDKKRPAASKRTQSKGTAAGGVNNRGEQKKKAKTNAGSKTNGIIDLTDDNVIEKVPHAGKAKPKSGPSSIAGEEWACSACTFLNGPIALACGMCSKEKPM